MITAPVAHLSVRRAPPDGILSVSAQGITVAPRAPNRSAGNIIATAVSLIVTGATCFLVFVALVLFQQRCDETCDEGVVPEARAGHWWNSHGSWEWSAQLAAALVALLAAVVMTRQITSRRYGSGMVAGFLGVLSAGLWMAFTLHLV